MKEKEEIPEALKLKVLKFKDEISLSDANYHKLRKDLGLDEDLPCLNQIIKLRRAINTIIVKTMDITPFKNAEGTIIGSTLEVKQVVNLMKYLCSNPTGPETIKITWDERNTNGGMT